MCCPGEVAAKVASLDGAAFWRVEWRAGPRAGLAELVDDATLAACGAFATLDRARAEVDRRCGAANDGARSRSPAAWSAGDREVLERRVRETDKDFSAVAAELGRPVGDVLAYYYAVLAPDPSYAALLHSAPAAPETPV